MLRLTTNLSTLLLFGCITFNKDDDDDDWGDDIGDTDEHSPFADSGSDTGTDADAELDTDEDEDGTLGDCDEVTTKINDHHADTVEDPRVGDEWIVRMYCDDTVLLGANRLRFQPPHLATIDPVDTDAVFVSAGSGTMSMQAGNFIYVRDLTVTELSP